MSLPSNFNSIKVQLELHDEGYGIQTPRVFQFHKGTIRTDERALSTVTIGHFNSIKVQLERTRTAGTFASS